MELTNEFTVPVPVERAWAVLNDVELIAPCLPGAQLQEIEGDEFRGVVKVKVGPITAEYKGAATFKEQDEANRRIVLDASGRDTRGQGSASAVITATMTESDGSTHVVVDTDLTIKGKVAQFGRGMIAEVSAKLMTQFVECLEGKLEGEPATPGDEPAETATAHEDVATASTAGAGEEEPETVGGPATEVAGAEAPEGGAHRIDSQSSEPVDLLGAAGAPVAKRAGPIAAAIIVLLLLGRRRSRKRRTS